MRKTKVKTAALVAGWPLSFIFALLAVVLAFIVMAHAGHAQGIVRGAQEGSYEGHRVAGPSAGWWEAQSAPVSAAPWERSRVCSACPSRTTGTAIATATATAMGGFTATGITDAGAEPVGRICERNPPSILGAGTDAPSRVNSSAGSPS